MNSEKRILSSSTERWVVGLIAGAAAEDGNPLEDDAAPPGAGPVAGGDLAGGDGGPEMS
jgi:hypothetical protein